ncbi:MAG: UDP-3-O-acyl-N-acetylglucosamine deacetylase [Cyanobacteria bacterium P01_A01_bin.135]
METTAPTPDTVVVNQGTLAAPIEQRGVGLHAGLESQVRILPAPPNSGRVFVRSDVEPDNTGSGAAGLSGDRSLIPATLDHVVSTQLSTELGNGGVTVRTVEHLLAALVAMDIDNARIVLDGPEVPLLDGSARLWAESIAAVGRKEQGVGIAPFTAAPQRISIPHPLHLQEGEAWLAAFPASQCRLTYGIDFTLAAIGHQWASWIPDQEPFLTAIAPARTFGLAHQIDYLRQQGLIRGGSLENALVCDDSGWLNPPLRFSNEPARHKLLDLVGDMSLLGRLPRAHIVAYRASHRLHIQFAQQLRASAVQPPALSNALS